MAEINPNIILAGQSPAKFTEAQSIEYRMQPEDNGPYWDDNELWG